MDHGTVSTLKENLTQVVFIGGAPCSGKSTIADLLAERYNLHAYHIDQQMYSENSHWDANRQPVMYKWTTQPWETLWMQSADVLFEEVVAAYEEQWELAVLALANLARHNAILAEGNPFMPHLVAPLIHTRRQAIWLAPSPDFLRTTYLGKRSEMVHFILRDCTHPDVAARNWMDRDVRFAGWVRQNAFDLGMKVLDVDGARSLERNADIIAEHFRLKV